jgi:hypothetical protein
MAGTIPQLSIQEIEAGNRKLIEISKAQGIAQRALVDGNMNCSLIQLNFV